MSKHGFLPSLWGRDDKSWAGFDDLRRQLDAVFDGYPWNLRLPEVLGRGAGADLVPDMEMKDSDKEFHVSMELPGVDEKDIDISLSDQYLTISGEKKAESSKKEGDFFRSERSYGAFSRTVALPFRPESDKVQAKFTKGVLNLTIPKPVEIAQSARKIAISAADE